MRRTTTWQLVRVDVSGLAPLVAGLEQAFDVLNGGMSAAVNRVTESVREQTVETIVSQVNLDRGYVDGKVEVGRFATADKPSAEIEIQDDPVFLSRYGARQGTQSNVWTPAMYAAKFGSLDAKVRPRSGAPRMPWTDRTGDPKRGISPGQKADGIYARIGRSKPETHFRHVFTAGALSGKTQAGRVGTFSHVQGSDRLKPVYGPTPYQAAKGVWRDAEEAIKDQLGTEITNEVEARIIKAITE